VGAGRSEALQCLFGISVKTKGTVRLNGVPLNIASPHEAIAAGLSYVPEDRQVQGAVLPFGIRENTTLASLDQHSSGGFLSRSRERDVTRK
jgi:rhamnose transport system ATP-binding protein